MRARTVWVLGHRVTLIRCGAAVFALDITTPAGVPGPPPHFHRDAEEMFHVLDGAIELRHGDEWLRLEAGETFTVPKGVVHTFRNPTDGDVRWLTGWNPLGFQEWFAEIGLDATSEEAGVRSLTPDVIETAVAASARYDMVVAPD